MPIFNHKILLEYLKGDYQTEQNVGIISIIMIV